MKSTSLSIRPYARLLTMLGDQLIKNERIALVELIKNAYDADATKVEVRFEHFGDNMVIGPQSRIVVADNGEGMPLETIQDQWMNPAAPQKHLAKLRDRALTERRGRVIQGEKGIGRFAVLKLGRVVDVVTRARGARQEATLRYDFSMFDDDFVFEDGEQRDIFLDEIEIACVLRDPSSIVAPNHGTTIEISGLKGLWTEAIVDQLCRDVSNLTDPVSRIRQQEPETAFEIAVYCNGVQRSVNVDTLESIRSLIEDKAVLGIRGGFVSQDGSYSLTMEEQTETISLTDPKIKGLWIWRQRFGRSRQGDPEAMAFTCGDFRFEFHIFDFARGIGSRYLLTQAEKNVIRKHRIYLYRDDMRVYPYGDPDDDWLNIDVTRGTGRAGDFFSNDQVIGWIEITQAGNPRLRDKTNREGLIETGGAAEDLMFLVKTVLSYLKQYPFARYQQQQQKRNAAKAAREDVVGAALAKFQVQLREEGHAAHARQVGRIQREYKREKGYLVRRADLTEDLAGVGLSVEMASHDIMLLMGRADEIGSELARRARGSGDDVIVGHVDRMLGVMNQIASGMKDIQGIFRSSRRRRKPTRVEPLLDKIHEIYAGLLERRKIGYDKDRVTERPLMANTTDGVVMQVLINLFDNACYWLETVDEDAREIRVTVDGERGELVFSDSGPGIDKEDLPYVFEPFYSGKGEEGRGLGLYIARQLLERHDYAIEVVLQGEDSLPGANFLVRFATGDE